MKNPVVTIAAVVALAIATATVAIGAQVTETANTMSRMSDALSRAVLQMTVSGTVAGVGSLPSTSTVATDGAAFAALAFVAIVGGFALIRKAITER